MLYEVITSNGDSSNNTGGNAGNTGGSNTPTEDTSSTGQVATLSEYYAYSDNIV